MKVNLKTIKINTPLRPSFYNTYKDDVKVNDFVMIYKDKKYSIHKVIEEHIEYMPSCDFITKKINGFSQNEYERIDCLYALTKYEKNIYKHIFYSMDDQHSIKKYETLLDIIISNSHIPIDLYIVTKSKEHYIIKIKDECDTIDINPVYVGAKHSLILESLPILSVHTFDKYTRVSTYEYRSLLEEIILKYNKTPLENNHSKPIKIPKQIKSILSEFKDRTGLDLVFNKSIYLINSTDNKLEYYISLVGFKHFIKNNGISEIQEQIKTKIYFEFDDSKICNIYMGD